ncbi:MAG: hypothetical protein IJH64_08435 [Oscillospiraceae bacterium]|nr:hypothetical protein [Oscillospiraceae bacterium]
MNGRLHDYLDYKEVVIETVDGKRFQGVPICVNYPEDTGLERDELIIENDQIIGFEEEEIAKIIIISE